MMERLDMIWPLFTSSFYLLPLFLSFSSSNTQSLSYILAFVHAVPSSRTSLPSPFACSLLLII